MENAQRCSPVFLVGCHRSGTTLARYLLDAHPRLACPPESKFIAGLESFLRYPQAENGLRSLGFSGGEIRREIRRTIEAFLGGYARRNGKRRWIDKTPNYYRLLPFLDEIFEGEARYLFLARHPLDCADSLHEYYSRRRRFEDPEIARAAERYGTDRRGWARYWKEVYEHIHSFLSERPDRCHVFRYEDLVHDPEATLRGALHFLGERLPRGLVETAFGQQHTPGYEDYKIRGTGRIESGSIGKWRSWPAGEARAVWKLVRSTALRFGYGFCLIHSSRGTSLSCAPSQSAMVHTSNL